MHLNAIGEFGGVNSINNFARSWQRAAAFHEVTPQRPAFVLASDSEEQRFPRSEVEPRTDARASLLQQHFLHRGSDEAIQDDRDAEGSVVSPLLQGNDEARKSLRSSDFGSIGGSPRGRESIFGLAGSYGTSYGTIRSTVNESSMAHAGRLWRQQQETGDSLPDGERPPLLVKEVEQDGKIVLVIDGQSTLPQTVFNSTNVLIGIGILSLPLGMKYAGWLCGTIFLALAALVTGYTAKLLAKCMDVDPSLITFADLAFISVCTLDLATTLMHANALVVWPQSPNCHGDSVLGRASRRLCSLDCTLCRDPRSFTTRSRCLGMEDHMWHFDDTP